MAATTGPATHKEYHGPSLYRCYLRARTECIFPFRWSRQIAALGSDHWRTHWQISPPNTLASCIFMLEIDRGGRTAALSRESSDVEIWDLLLRKQVRTLSGHSDIVTAMSYFHGEEPCFFTASLDKSIILWRDYEKVATMSQHNDWLRCLAISEHNRTLLSGCVSSVIMGWDVSLCKPVFRIANKVEDGQMNTINSLVFANGSDNIFVSGTRDGWIRFFDSRCTTKPALAYRAHTQKLNTVSFNAENTALLTSARDSTIKLWDLRMLSVCWILSKFYRTLRRW